MLLIPLVWTHGVPIALTKATGLKLPAVAEQKKRRKKMKNSMKLFASVAFAAVLGVAPAFAQMPTTLRADVPFDFSLCGKPLPAGEYTIAEKTGSPAIVFRNSSTEETVTVLTGWHANTSGNGDSKLVFHKSGNRYYLASVTTAGEAFDRVTLKSKAERESESASREMVVASIKAVRQ
jgi:hypothetical protein